MNKRISITLIALLLVSSVLTACGGPAPVTFSSLPVFTGATETANELLSATLSAALDAGKTADPTIASMEGKAYDLPAGTTFDALKAFYTDALTKGGWTAISSGADVALAFNRGKQQLAITHIAPLDGLMVMLANIK